MLQVEDREAKRWWIAGKRLARVERAVSSWAVMAILAAVWGCGSSDAGSTSSATNPPTAGPVSATPPASCPNPEGGSCLGPLGAGSYKTVEFDPPTRYTLPSGWANLEDTPGNFLLLPPGNELAGVNAGTSDFIGIYTSVAAAAPGCNEGPAPGVDSSPSAIASYMTKQRGLRTTTPRRIEVGGLKGLVIDIELAQGWKKTCPFSSGRPTVQLITGLPPSGLDHGMIPGLAWRLYLLRLHGGAMAIEVDDFSGGNRLSTYAAVIRTLRFAS